MTRQDTAPDVDDLLPRIIAALEVSGVSQTRFGFEVGGDPALVNKMKRGRRVYKEDLRARIEAKVADMLAAAALEG